MSSVKFATIEDDQYQQRHITVEHSAANAVDELQMKMADFRHDMHLGQNSHSYSKTVSANKANCTAGQGLRTGGIGCGGENQGRTAASLQEHRCMRIGIATRLGHTEPHCAAGANVGDSKSNTCS